MTDFIWFVFDTLFSLLFFFFHPSAHDDKPANKQMKNCRIEALQHKFTEKFPLAFLAVFFCCMYDVQTELIYLLCPGLD